MHKSPVHLVYSVTPRESLCLQIQHRSLLGRDAEIFLTPMNLSPVGWQEVAATPQEGQGPRGRARGERGVPRGLGAQHCAAVSSVSSHHNRSVAKRRRTPSDAAVDPSHTVFQPYVCRHLRTHLAQSNLPFLPCFYLQSHPMWPEAGLPSVVVRRD